MEILDEKNILGDIYFVRQNIFHVQFLNYIRLKIDSTSTVQNRQETQNFPRDWTFNYHKDEQVFNRNEN